MNPNVVSYSNMDDIVFEDRNKGYGAYILRRTYSKHIMIAMIICLGSATLAIGIPVIIKLLKPEEKVEKIAKPQISVADLAPPPPITATPPPPKFKLPPPPTAVIKFLPPKVTEKEVPEEEEMPTIEEVKKAPVIGAENVEGPTDIVFEEAPAEIGTGDEASSGPQIFTVVEQMPEFPGGMGELNKFISRNVRYPDEAIRKGIEGTVYLSFIVDAEGNVTDIQVMKGLSREVDEEAIRVVKKMPKWKPGKQSGRAVIVRYSFPFRFKLNQ